MKITYPVLQIFLTLGFSEMQREGIDLDVSVLPSLASIIRHVEPGVTTLVREKNGLVYVSRQSLPVNVGLPAIFGATMFFGFAMQPASFAPAEPPVLLESVKPRFKPVPEEKLQELPSKSRELSPAAEKSKPPTASPPNG